MKVNPTLEASRSCVPRKQSSAIPSRLHASRFTFRILGAMIALVWWDHILSLAPGGRHLIRNDWGDSNWPRPSSTLIDKHIKRSCPLPLPYLVPSSRASKLNGGCAATSPDRQSLGHDVEILAVCQLPISRIWYSSLGAHSHSTVLTLDFWVSSLNGRKRTEESDWRAQTHPSDAPRVDGDHWAVALWNETLMTSARGAKGRRRRIICVNSSSGRDEMFISTGLSICFSQQPFWEIVHSRGLTGYSSHHNAHRGCSLIRCSS